MKKLWFLIGIIVLSGCLTMRTYTKEEPRKDFEIEGNRGCLSGECEEEIRDNRLGDTRTISVVEVEFGSRGIKGEAFKAGRVGAKVPFQKMEGVGAVSGEGLASAEKIETRYYVVQKNDTLQKISHKFYGTTRKWEFLYKTNKDVLKSPDKLYPGAELLILPLDE